MIFWKKPDIEFHTIVPELEKIAPIVKASSLIPNWWKNSDKRGGQVFFNGTGRFKANIKSCPGIGDLLLSGFILTSWADIFIDPKDGNDIEIESSINTDMVSVRPIMGSTFKRHLPENINNIYNHIIQIETPWVVKTTKGYGLNIADPFYFFNQDFICSPGILHTDFYHILNIQLMIKNKEPFIIPFGTPLAILQPFKKEKYSYKVFPNNKKGQALYQKSSLIRACKFVRTVMYNTFKRNFKCPFS